MLSLIPPKTMDGHMKPKKDSRPRFSEFVSIEEELVKARLRAARVAIDHPGEKGVL